MENFGSELWLTGLFFPFALALAAFVRDEIKISRERKRNGGAKPEPAPAVVGQPVAMATTDVWAERAYQNLSAQLKAEMKDHMACHAAMRAAGVDVPHD